jgi:hypothetical protein
LLDGRGHSIRQIIDYAAGDVYVRTAHSDREAGLCGIGGIGNFDLNIRYTNAWASPSFESGVNPNIESMMRILIEIRFYVLGDVNKPVFADNKRSVVLSD